MPDSLHKEIGYDIMEHLHNAFAWSELTDVNEYGCYQRLLLENGCSIRYTRWRDGKMPFYIILFNAKNDYIFELDLSMLTYNDDIYQWHLKKPQNKSTLAAVSAELGETVRFSDDYVAQVKLLKEALNSGINTPKNGFDFLSNSSWETLTSRLLQLIIAVYQAHDVKLVDESAFLDEADNDSEEYENLQRRIRRGQRQLKLKLLEVYGAACAISGSGPVEVLEAAHIVGHAESGVNDSCNALLLRADIHILFDRHLLKIEPHSFKIILDKSLKKTDYWQWNGKKLRKRTDGLTPSPEYLARRWFGDTL